MTERRGDTLLFHTPPVIAAQAAVGGKKESEGPLAAGFDELTTDNWLGQRSWEAAEKQLQLRAARLCLQKASLPAERVDLALAGDLQAQCTASGYALRELGVPFAGLFGACSTMAEALEIAEVLKNLYRTGEADEIHLVYQRFDSVLHQTPAHRQLLPAAPEADAPAANNNYLFVPDAQTVLDNVLELYLNNTVYAVMLEARVGEHAARMTAMTAATDSTAELIEDLNLEFNRARQAAITTEISEIVGGSAALKKSDKSD